MAAKQTVLLLGATGETGSSILEGLLEANQFNVEILVRPSSAEKPAVKKIVSRGVRLRVAELGAPADELAKVLSGVDILVSAIGPQDCLQQKVLVKAAKDANVERFVPCAFITIAPPKGVMLLRDEKEEVYNEIKRLALNHTIIDVGYWHQISFPRVPSGRVDYATVIMDNTIHADGNAPNILTDLRDIGRFVARIITDERTLNKYVYTWGDVLTENEIFSIVEELSGEKIEKNYVSAETIEKQAQDAAAELSQNPQDPSKRYPAYISQYQYSKYVRQDNRPWYAKFLGYLDARELYPDFKPISFRECVQEALDGKGRRPYSG
ncbi:hypothetical protein Plec18167_004976 [Paecilomyces lecythidis]|uniref:NmrA-like domain-containing protein n=1 Tax=Paecilomyces lecythidis TaxID=3004212 RepID=A0ABR3XP39_9EURO